MPARWPVNLNLFYTRHSGLYSCDPWRDSGGQAAEGGLKKGGGTGIVGREIAASRLLKQLVKLRMARERESVWATVQGREVGVRRGGREPQRIYRIGKIDAQPWHDTPRYRGNVDVHT